MSFELLALVVTTETTLMLVMLGVLVGRRMVLLREEKLGSIEESVASEAFKRWIGGTASQQEFLDSIGSCRPATVLALLHKYAIIIRGDRWDELISMIRESGWFAYVTRYARSRFWWRRLVAVRLLSILGREEDLPLISRLFSDRNQMVRIAVVPVLGRVNEQALVERLVVMALSSQPVVRGYLFQALARLGESVLPVIKERVGRSSSRSELAILLALVGELNAVELLGTVTENARHESACVRLTVATVLRAFPHPESADALASLLSDSVAEVRAQAAVSLGLIGGMEKTGVLQNALDDAEGNVRVNAGIALRRLGVEGLELLRNARRSGTDRAGEAARFVLNLEEPALSGYRGQEYGSLVATVGGLY